MHKLNNIPSQVIHDVDSLVGMFSQRTGLQQSMSSTIMSTITTYLMQNFMQRGLSGFLGSGGNDKNSMKFCLVYVAKRDR